MKSKIETIESIRQKFGVPKKVSAVHFNPNSLDATYHDWSKYSRETCRASC